MDEASDEVKKPLTHLPFATAIVSFEPGEGAGYGRHRLPDVVLGPPGGGSATVPSLDVLSLGRGGQIVLSFEPREIVDGPGPDLIVFENPFWPNGDAEHVWAELGEVAVSEDGVTWHTFVCETRPAQPGRWPGCAGWTPTKRFDPELLPLHPDETGGDAFDLADVGLTRARFVRIRDVSQTLPDAPTAGFDLDAVGLIHYESIQR